MTTGFRRCGLRRIPFDSGTWPGSVNGEHLCFLVRDRRSRHGACDRFADTGPLRCQVASVSQIRGQGSTR